jgi:hypothetical protein
VNVAAPVVVAALVNGNAAVAVINAMNEHATGDGGGRYRWHAALPDELIGNEPYERGVDLLERIVAMLTKLIDP